jgi:two-component system sensor histidine kinase VicK
MLRYCVWMCFALLFLGTAGCRQKKYSDNGDYSEEFKPILKKANLIFFEQDKTKQGLRYLDSAFATIPHPHVNDKFRVYGFHFVYANRVIYNREQSLVYADSMMLYAKKSVTEKQYAANFTEANFTRGDALFDLKRFNEAYQCFFEGYNAGRNYLNNDALSDFTYRMGMIMYRLDNFKLAGAYFKQSLQHSLAGTVNFVTFYRQQEIMDNIALCYKKNNQPDSALTFFNQTLDFIDQHEHLYADKANMLQIARGVVYGNKAEILLKQGQYNTAAALLKKSIAINLRKGNDYKDAQLTEIKLGQLYLNSNQPDSLENLLMLMRKQFDTVKNELAEAEWNRLAADYRIKKNDFKSAVNYLKEYNIRKDSIDKKLNDLKESDVTQQVANYENQQKIDSLRNNNKLKNIYLVVALVCAVMLTLIIFLVQRNWKRSKNEVKVVNQLNEQIFEQNSILENTLDELNINSREKDRILRTVAHDLRNPLGGIASLTTSMIDDDDYTQEQIELINLIKETSYNSLELINEILEATNSSLAKLNKEYVEINSLLSNSVELLRFKAAEKDQKISLELLSEPKELYISREKIWRVISNLISNATKFSPFGATINVRITEEGHDEVKIAVNDHGIGIPDHLKNEVFNMFTDAKRPGTAGEKSFGLGLSICKQIIEKHNGKIWFESNREHGTTFFIKLNKESLAA